MRRTLALALTLTLAVSWLGAGIGVAHDGQHGVDDGHLLGDGAWGKIKFVGQVTVHDAEPDLIADVTAFGNYAYLARWGGEDCAGPETGGQRSPDGGVYIIDISDPTRPVEVGFIATHQDTLVGEGLQVIHIDTAKFTGDVLLMNHEGCGKNYKGGVSLWDVTNPLKPKKLSEHFGDITIGGVRDRPDVNQTHSAFMWDAGARAYLVATDDEEASDVDIFDITDPKKPVLIGEFDLNQFAVSQPELALTDSFLHDMVVKEINGRWIMLLSYWDGGYVLLDVTNPASPRFLGDSDYAAVDPELLQQNRSSLTPEGNGHQAEFTALFPAGQRYVIGADEDFDPYRYQLKTAEPDAFLAKLGTQTSFAALDGLTGTPVFVGRACNGDPAVPTATVGQVAVVERGLCTFEEKAQNVIRAGYRAMIIMNREGSDACTDVFFPNLQAAIPTILIGRDSGFDLFDVPFNLAACLDGTPQRAPIAIGTTGDAITDLDQTFDGWGYVHLFGVSIGATSATLTDLDTFAIREAMDPAFATGFGDLSVHEVATDPYDPTLAYLSYYSGGLRAIQITENAATCAAQGDTSPCLVEVGGYLSPTGNDFWGVEFHTLPNGTRLILASDRDSGLWIFRDP